MTAMIAKVLATNWRILPVVLAALIWLFFNGFRAILKARRDRLVRELLLCCSCFGLLFAVIAFATYGLVDPANHFARAGAVPVAAEALERFAIMGYSALAVGLLAGVLLELRIRRA